MGGQVLRLKCRERATSRAVAADRGEITRSSGPDLFIDGFACCDQFTAHRLAHLQLIIPQRAGAAREQAVAANTATAPEAQFDDADGRASAA